MVRIRIFLVFFICVVFISSAIAASVPSLSDGIEAYKNGNYEDCISKMKYIVKDDPTSVIGYYYLGLAYSKTGQKLLAIQNYNKVINLNSDSTMTALARQGKNSLGLKTVSKIENQLEQIEEEIKEDSYNPILEDENTKTGKLDAQNKAENISEPQKAPQTTHVIKASEYAKASQPSQNNSQPTNDEIVNAIRTLQRAGILQNGQIPNMGGMQNQMPMMDARTQQMNAMLMMMNNGNNGNNMNMMQQMMPYMNNGGKVDPQMVQMMLMNQMMPNFNSGNNGNGY
jgi:tetratricopeptide (TPR) repeat protein